MYADKGVLVDDIVRRPLLTMTLILQAVLVMLATVLSNLVESTDLPPVPEDSNHTAKLEGSEPLPLPPEHYVLEPTAILPHERAYFQARTVTRYVTKTERYYATTVTRTVNISPTLVPEVPELPGDYCNGPGQFLFGATNECFLYLSDGLRTFEDADAECRKGGMRLAKPKKPKAIQKHLVTVLGHSGHVWLGARGDGHSFKWQTNDGAAIRNTDPNWWNGMPAYHVTKEYCLALVAYPNAVTQEKMFYPESCSLKRTALCQREECSPQCTLGTCTGPNTCVYEYDPRSEAICPDGCGNGQCTGPNECTCSDGYEGDTCDKPTIPDCPAGAGFFRVQGSHQCFKFFKTPKISWSAAKTKCTEQGLVLAQLPGDVAIAVQKYLYNIHGSSVNAWVDAQSDGSTFVWGRDGTKLSNKSPLWHTSEPSHQGTNYCIRLMIWDEAPFDAYYCSQHLSTLCEAIN